MTIVSISKSKRHYSFLAVYSFSKNRILLMPYNCNEGNILNIINHELIHHAIESLGLWKESLYFDNIDYHSIFEV